MLKNYFKVAWRNLIRHKAYSALNITGLAAGMAVAILIGLWIQSELTFNKMFPNYQHLAKVMQHQTFNGEVGTQTALPFPMGDQLRKEYGADFKQVCMSSWIDGRLLAYGEKKITKSGNYYEPQITSMLSLHMLSGRADALKDKYSVILSKSTAEALFGRTDPMNKTIKIENTFNVTVKGIYEDLPENSDFKDVTFIAPWQLMIDNNNWPEKATNPWRSNSFQALVLLNDNADMEQVSAKIRDVKLRQVTKADAAFKPVVFLQPMSMWHLYSEYKNGINTGGRISNVWQFGVIGFFVLLLACINFMNLSTARSEKRAMEVGIRKAIGSLRGQLIRQFFTESLLVAVFAFICALLLTCLLLPYFNEISGKNMHILWREPLFWLAGIAFTLFTGLFAGIYPALYLSSFRPVKVLKGTFRAGRNAVLPRQILIVLQFGISVILIIGTLVVICQVRYAMNRPVGYSKARLVALPVVGDDLHKNFAAVAAELKGAGVVSEMAEASGMPTNINEVDNGFEWSGKDPAIQGDFATFYGSVDMGKTLGWQIKEGRGFSKDFATDSAAMVLNETAVKFMGLKHPVGQTITWDKRNYTVIGVAKDMVMGSPYMPVYRAVFVLYGSALPFVDIRINPRVSTHTALARVAAVFKKYNPSQPFDYQFVDEAYAQKFSDEQRIGRLTGGFAVLAIFISCLGLLGMASFMAEQRRKEIGIRKVLGDTVFGIWQLLSKEFLILILIALIVAMPLAYYFMHSWLQHYDYHTDITWPVFALTAIATLVITLLTVSYQSIRAALTNPVKSLRSE
ncbi:MAG: transporter permease [Mucilaginibacter sp.]|nr:transporter permease [Mucilaginibacter sp.]